VSLVHDALQKAEREKQRKTGVVPAPPPPRPESPSTPTVSSVAGAGPATTAPVPSAAAVTVAVEPPQSNHALLTILISCVAVVALVAIVYLVGSATATIRESQRGVSAVAPAPVSAPAVQNTTPPSEPTRALSPPAPESPAPSAEEPRFRVTGITKDSDGNYLAIINGQLRSVNQYVDGATIKKIERDRVTLEVDGHEQVLRLF